MNRLLLNQIKALKNGSLIKESKIFYSKDILRGRYEKKKTTDGRYIEYNETVTVVPSEFEDQGNSLKLQTDRI